LNQKEKEVFNPDVADRIDDEDKDKLNEIKVKKAPPATKSVQRDNAQENKKWKQCEKNKHEVCCGKKYIEFDNGAPEVNKVL